MTKDENKDDDNKVTDIDKKKRDKFDKDALAMIKSTYDKVEKLKLDRKSINDQITAEFAMLESKGFNKKAVKATFTYINLSDDDKQNWDNSSLTIRQALGDPLQNDLFAANMNAAMDK